MLSLTPAKPVKVSDIYLSKEQINTQTPGNLLHTFFTNVRPPKKVLEDQLTQVIDHMQEILNMLDYWKAFWKCSRIYTPNVNILAPAPQNNTSPHLITVVKMNCFQPDSKKVWHSQTQ